MDVNAQTDTPREELSDCSIKEEGYEALSSALKSNPSSHLTDLDLRGNDPGDSGVKKLTEILEDPNCKLKKLSFLKTPAAEEACDWLRSTVGTHPLLLRELDLSNSKPGDSGVKKLSVLLEDLHCKIWKIKLSNCGITEEGCSALSSVLGLGFSSLRELYMCNNTLKDSGVIQLSAGLKNQQCKLEILSLSDCSITEEGYTALSSALKSNPSSHLTDLDLRGNDPGDSGVKLLTEILVDPNCKLEKLR
ncbi:ribonuclease inhibitor-like [Brachyhypopomus gauderio]|uniref:ribonuclease inhibitor-like n=1 Tax=Brachyhypopomus gauderio TaxID=698409 RepID=UPI0040428930